MKCVYMYIYIYMYMHMYSNVHTVRVYNGLFECVNVLPAKTLDRCSVMVSFPLGEPGKVCFT